jgi:hypothetical protein
MPGEILMADVHFPIGSFVIFARPVNGPPTVGKVVRHGRDDGGPYTEVEYHGERLKIDRTQLQSIYCKACARRASAGFDGQCPACANERVQRELGRERAGSAGNLTTVTVTDSQIYHLRDANLRGEVSIPGETRLSIETDCVLALKLTDDAPALSEDANRAVRLAARARLARIIDSRRKEIP